MFGILLGQMSHFNVSYLASVLWNFEYLITYIWGGLWGKETTSEFFRIMFKSLEAFAFTRRKVAYTTFISESCVFVTVMLLLLVLLGSTSSFLWDRSSEEKHIFWYNTKLIWGLIGPVALFQLSDSEVFQTFWCLVWSFVPFPQK